MLKKGNINDVTYLKYFINICSMDNLFEIFSFLSKTLILKEENKAILNRLFYINRKK